MATKEFDRRTMIKGAALAGVAAWTAPVILGSLTSPAAAGSGGGLPTTCSYALVVFKYGAAGPYIMKIAQDSASCSFTNSTSNDTSFNSYSCGVYQYRGGRDYGAKIQYSSDGGKSYRNVSVYPSGTCDKLFTVSGTTITRLDANASIIFGTSHSGNAFRNVCPSGGGGSSSVTVECGSS